MNAPFQLPGRRRALRALGRRLLGGAATIAAPAVWRAANAAPTGTPPRPTPAQTEGPFYPHERPEEDDADLLRVGALAPARGTPAWVEGEVTDLDGRPLRGATVEIWQCDAAGHYRHPRDAGPLDPGFQGVGRVTVDADGRYRFRTLRPVPYPGRTPHIHFKLWLGPRELLTTQLYVEGDPGNARDGLWRRLDAAERAVLTRPFAPGADGLRAHFPIAIAT